MQPTNPFPGQADLQQASLLIARGKALQQAGNLQGAVQAYQQAVQRTPLSSAGYRALLDLLFAADDIANATTVVKAVPPVVYQQSAPIRYLHARVLLRQAQAAQALPLLQGLAGDPEIDAPGLSYNLGQCLAQLGDHAGAVAAFERAYNLGLKADWLYLGWARSAQLTGDLATAERWYRDLCRLHPDNSSLKYEQAITLLKAGQYAAGFRLYAHRWNADLPHFKDSVARDIGLPSWDGRKPVRSLLVVREQGLGEQILFSSLLPAIRSKVGRLAVAFDPRLSPLVGRSWDGIECIDPTESFESLRGRFEACISAADMGGIVTEATGWKHGPLKVDQDRAAQLREKYRQQFPGKKLVGISWMSKQSALSEAKSMDLLAWRPLLEQSDCQFVSLQYGNVEPDLARARERLGVEIHRDAEIDAFQDIDGLAAQMVAMDLVVSTSNSTAHLAAAVHAPTWILLPAGWGLLWYWGQGPCCPWYPEARLFRCSAPDDWMPVLASVGQALSGYLPNT